LILRHPNRDRAQRASAEARRVPGNDGAVGPHQLDAGAAALLVRVAGIGIAIVAAADEHAVVGLATWVPAELAAGGDFLVQCRPLQPEIEFANRVNG
jgi:hypothetical protein